MPQLTEEAISAPDADLNLKELNAAISSFLSNKASGPDGFSMDFLELTPLLLPMFNHSKEAIVLHLHYITPVSRLFQNLVVIPY